MGREFWRTIRMAIKEDNWTARLVIVLYTTAAAGFGACASATGR